MKNINILFIALFLLLVCIANSNALTSGVYDSPCNQSYTKDTLNMFNTSININWSTGILEQYYILNYSDLLIDYTYCNTTDTYCNLTTNDFSSGYYYQRLYTCDLTDCVLDNTDCYIHICSNNWVANDSICINGIKTVSYNDINNCGLEYNKPNNTIGSCTNIVYNQTTYSTDTTILIILFLFMIISLICAIFVHEGFFGLCALILSLMLLTFIQYKYPTILIYITIFMIILFSIMWIVIHRIKRN